ncbi:MAG TPA: hypothetical protein VG674_08945 [Amycolatopsis sp.]|nr:hypothetical protein [Amycolatopsis sp.]
MSFPATSRSGPPAEPGAGADVKTFVTAVLLTFGVGLLGLLGYGLLGGGFGGFIGLVAGGFGVYWWHNIHGKVFARDLPTRSVVVLLVVNVVLAAILFFITR